MKKKLLGCALLMAVGMAQSAAAQDFDDRWYITAGAGVAAFDRDRNASDDAYGEIGFGKFISPHISLDAQLWHTNPELNKYVGSGAQERNWELTSLMIVGRYHFIREGRDWNPYISAGIGAQEHHDGTQVNSLAIFGYSPSRTGTDLAASLGLGFQKDLGYASIRGETGVRYDADDESHDLEGPDSHFIDAYLGFTFLFPIGPEAEPAPEPVPVVQKTCADLDDDGDGVNNCDDKCPGSQAGMAVGPDGCPVPPPEPEPVMEPKPFRG
jgi:OOP family OmpA-OmpF porin